jgi:hypothetical protein
MQRIAFTIVYEGEHHLKHKNFAEKMASMFDHWIVVEGYALPNGSTRWCKKLPVPPTSTDGTVQFMRDFANEHKNVHFYSKGDYYDSKDTQVNIAITILKKICRQCYLWEVDADEHWNEESLLQAEQFAGNSPLIGFKFQFNHYVGPGIIATGDWGSGFLNRLWKWTGQYFLTHEPAVLRGQRGVAEVPDVKFDHYSYYFPKDVSFKAQSYPDHERVGDNWPEIQVKPGNKYPMHISKLFGEDSKIGKSNSLIVQI